MGREARVRRSQTMAAKDIDRSSNCALGCLATVATVGAATPTQRKISFDL